MKRKDAPAAVSAAQTKTAKTGQNPRHPARKWTLLSLYLVLAAALALALILPTALRGKVILSHKGDRMREGVFRFLYSYYRYRIPASDYYKAQGVKDTAAFWDRLRSNGETEGEYYGNIALRLIEETFAAAALYDSCATMTASQRTAIKEAEEAVLLYSYKGGGSKKSFNEKAAPMGFDWQDFCDGTLLLWKAEQARTALYGASGTGIGEEEADRYLRENYYALKLIFVRTENTFVTDASGVPVVDDNGRYETRPLTEKERQEAETHLAAVRSGLAGGLSDEAAFDALYLEHSDKTAGKGISETHYLTRTDADATSAYTAAFAADFPALVEAAGEMTEPLVTREVFVKGLGYFFLLPVGVTDGAYGDKTFSECFSEDFYDHASAALFTKRLSEEVGKIRIRAQDFIDGLDFANTIPNKSLYAVV